MTEIELDKVESHLWRARDRKGVYVGWVALSRNPNGQFEFSWGVRKESQGTGVGSRMAEQVLAWFREHKPGEEAIAVIRLNNAASLGLARHIGMRVLTTDGDNVFLTTAAEEVTPTAVRPRRAEALARLDAQWGPLPEESLDWARERLGVSERSTGQ